MPKIETTRLKKMRFDSRTLLIVGLISFELPLFLGFRFGNPVTLPGAILLFLSILRSHKCGTLNDDASSILTKRFAIILGVVLLFLWALLVQLQYAAIRFNNFDTGIFANNIFNFLNNKGYYSSVLQKSAFADHFTPNLLAIAPLFSVFPSFLNLPYLKLIAFFCGAIIAYRIGIEVLTNDSRLRFIPPVIWMIHILLSKMLETEFQPSSLAIPFILLSYLFAMKHSYKSMLLCLVVLLGFKEHLSLVWISMGIFLWTVQKKRLFGITLILFGFALGFSVYFIASPWLSGGLPAPHVERFNPISNPMEKVFAITTALASFAFLPLCAPSTLLWTIPAFGISLVSNQKEMLSFSHHYFDVPLTVMFVGFVFGLKSVRDNTGLTRFLPAQRQSAIALAFGCALLFQHTRLPTYWIRKSLPNSHERALVTEVERLQMAVPENAAIWVPDSLGPYLARHYGLRSILDTSPELLGGPNEVWIVLASGINHWPLNDEQVNELEQWVKQRVEQGQLIKQSEFVHLQVYATNRTDSR